MNVLDLFSGIGGFSLGLERAGMRTIAFCEIDPYCQAVLRKHWPNVPIWSDVRTVTAEWLSYVIGIMANHSSNRWGEERQGRFNSGGERQQQQAFQIDVICGGFPCQDISVAGKGAGIEGERSGLWSEYARIIGEVRPRYVIVENVAALLGRGIERVLGDLAALGYDAEWHCIPAAAVGAPHRRDRVWIIAHTGSKQHEGNCASFGGKIAAQLLGHANGSGVERQRPSEFKIMVTRHARGKSESASDGIGKQWAIEPDVGRVANGVPFRVDRLRALGNAIVPQIAEIIGKAVMSHDKRCRQIYA